MIEQVQEQAAKLIPTIRNLSYKNRLRKFELATLKDRRLRGDMIQMFKIMKDITKFSVFLGTNLDRTNRCVLSLSIEYSFAKS